VSRKDTAPAGWLFPELRRGKNNSDAFNKRFNDFLHQRLNLKQLVQYGLRHTWEDERRRAQAHASSTQGAWPPGMFFAIAGRASTEEEEGSAANYGAGYDVSDLKFFLDQLRFAGVEWPTAWPDWAKLYGPSLG
jgi:outer membrane receptor for Fe3+-dicitrate